jgi:proteic killer suppression protein
MIRSFRDKEAERIFLREPRATSSRPLQRAALRKLLMLHAAESLDDLLVPPGNRLEKLGGDRSGQYSIRINDQWRICFIWEDGDAHEVEIVDDH